MPTNFQQAQPVDQTPELVKRLLCFRGVDQISIRNCVFSMILRRAALAVIMIAFYCSDLSFQCLN